MPTNMYIGQTVNQCFSRRSLLRFFFLSVPVRRRLSLVTKDLKKKRAAVYAQNQFD